MSKTKRTGHSARLAALEKDLRRLRAQLPKEIHHAVRTEIRVALNQLDPPPVVAGTYKPVRLTLSKTHAIGSDAYSERDGEGVVVAKQYIRAASSDT
jgi:hypothetical protein